MTQRKGIYPNVPMGEYRQWEGFGASDLKAFRIGPPALVPWRRSHPFIETDATRLGTAAHCAIIEPAAFGARFVHKPEGMTFASKEGKDWKASVAPGVTILTNDEWIQVRQLVDAFASKPLALESLANATGLEHSLAWSDPDTGLAMKARPDWYEAGGFVTDLKITRHAAAQSIQLRAFTEGWMHQLAHYQAGLMECGVKIRGGRLVMINPEPPQEFRVYCVELKQDAIGLLHLENERTVAALAECAKSGDWPGAPDEWTQVDVPSFVQPTVEWGDDDALTPETAKRRS